MHCVLIFINPPPKPSITWSRFKTPRFEYRFDFPDIYSPYFRGVIDPAEMIFTVTRRSSKYGFY
jgi:hypothetical protein